MLTLPEAYNVLRTEPNTGNDDIINGLLAATPSYIETATGIKSDAIVNSADPLINTLEKFLLCLWYNPDGTDAQQLQRVVDNLLKSLKAMAADINAAWEAQ